jgi:tRNA-dihydrouridine synthase A
MEYTDRHFRHLVRLISDRTLLYTEMVAANAIAHEREAALSSYLSTNNNNKPSSSLLDVAAATGEEFDPSYLLRFLGQGHNPEGASVLQLGGSDPDQLFLASKTVYEFNQLAQMQQQQQQQQSPNNSPSIPIFCDYTALNLNCGCPSPKVAGKGCFGAALMQDAQLVKQLTTSMFHGSEGTIPITVKCRIGTDEGYQFTRDQYNARSEEEEYQSLKQFIEIVASEGIVTDFQVHARIAVLGKNYSPADNRKVPPLRYYQVRRLAEEFPELNISLNGGVETLSGVKRELEECPKLDGIMVGRGWMSNPWAFAMSEELLYTENDGARTDDSTTTRPKNRMEVLEAYGRHADYEEELWDPVKIRRFITKAASQLFSGEPNAKHYRIALDEIAGLPKKLMKEDSNWMQSQPPLSELILEAATKHLSEEVLYRTPKESYEKILWDEEQAEKRMLFVAAGGSDGKPQAEEKKSFVQEWQQSRKEDELKESELNSM